MADTENKAVQQNTPTATTKGEQPTVEEHAAELKLEAWQFEGLRVKEDWPEGTRISRAKFEEKLEAWLTGDTDGNLEGA
jgi:hypothetical protein